MKFLCIITLFLSGQLAVPVEKCIRVENINATEVAVIRMDMMLTECREVARCIPEEIVMEIPSGGFVQLVYTCAFITEAPKLPLDPSSPTSSSSDPSFFDWLPELNLPNISIPSGAVFGVAVGLITTISAVIIGCTCCKCCNFNGRRRVRSRQQSGNTDSLIASSCATLETNV